MVAIAAGTSHSISVKQDGTVWAWGSNSSGELGDGTTVQRTIPVQIWGLSNVLSVDSKESNNLLVNKNRKVLAWGVNPDGGAGSSDIPIIIPGTQKFNVLK